MGGPNMMGPGPGMPMMGNQMSGPPQRPVTNRPLFPSAAQNAPNQQSIPKPTFPAYSDEGGPPGESRSLSPPTQPAVPLERPGASQKIVHPDNDVSLEEIRSRRREYSNMNMGGPNMNMGGPGMNMGGPNMNMGATNYNRPNMGPMGGPNMYMGGGPSNRMGPGPGDMPPNELPWNRGPGPQGYGGPPMGMGGFGSNSMRMGGPH